jgi:hypothetical protein
MRKRTYTARPHAPALGKRIVGTLSLFKRPGA